MAVDVYQPGQKQESDPLGKILGVLNIASAAKGLSEKSAAKGGEKAQGAQEAQGEQPASESSSPSTDQTSAMGRRYNYNLNLSKGY